MDSRSGQSWCFERDEGCPGGPQERTAGARTRPGCPADTARLSRAPRAGRHLAEANPGIAQFELARQLAIDKASVVALIDKLERARLITRRRSTVDRRRHGLFVSPYGTRQLKLLMRDIARHEQRFRDRLTAPELQQLIKLLKRLYD
jgi:DNA-binding MarR family transcriptional regulator